MKETKSSSLSELSYRSQIHHLRQLAFLALKKYSVRVAKLKFINHGENATFKVTSQAGAKFLLRLHRNDYHSPAGIREELRWLDKLSAAGVPVPRPLASKAGRLTEIVSHPVVGKRVCDVFHWIDGRFISKSIRNSDLYQVGQLLARIQKVGAKLPCRHRRYWTAEGLVGSQMQFGSIDQLPGATAHQQKVLTAARKRVFSKLKSYEKMRPEKIGLVHADLHFWNMLKTPNGEIAAIDFDDCGLGFLVYDLVIPLVSVEFFLRQNKKIRQYPKMKESLLAGYASLASFDDIDRECLQDLILARKLTMLAWLNSRSDVPRLKKRLREYTRSTVRYIDRPYL